MGFFQNSVINKYLAQLDKQIVQNAYAKFRTHFHNATIQNNIRSSKEEQYQGEFLIDLFVTVLGYTKNPTPNFNLTTEYKKVKDSKKADGAIVVNEVVKAVIELKGTNTTDLNKIEVQAFGYKNNQPECEYVIISNFEKLRFYVDNAIEYLEFNLFTLSEKEFELLYICLSYNSIAKGLPKQIKNESVSQEDLITKKLYKDYSVFKNELYHSLVKLNPQYEPLELFKISQKLLDRFLFIFFAEDRQLLPTNLIFRINKEWQQLKEMRIEVSLYDRYKIYFNDLNNGAKVSLPAFSQTASKQKEEFDIYAYNGGLFKTDELLNDIKIDDKLLFTHTENLSNYDFASEVDVNVLGHIFENSLNDVDEIKAQLEGKAIDKTKTKRKKDGVFYTPKYITKYIVDNTLGKLCVEKKEELQINEDNYQLDKKRQKKTTQALTEKLNIYRNWLLQLTICDPACGSGAFLNQALDFLITEHRYVDELQAKLFGDALVLSDVEGSILENNLFGVDINEESVEIAKLSLWLRTAQPNRKLNDLNNNIKCGNSLIDDVAVAGDKAFNWEQEFPQVFQNTEHDAKYVSVNERVLNKKPTVVGDELGKYQDDSFGLYNEFHEPKIKYKTTKEKKQGFDVIIGNPPYGSTLSEKDVMFFRKEYKTVIGHSEIYYLFTEKAITNLVNINGYLGLIIPNAWLSNKYAQKLRELLINETKIEIIINFNRKIIFEDANVETAIFIAKKTTFKNDFITMVGKDLDFLYEYKQREWNLNANRLISFTSNILLDKIIKKMNLSEHKLSDKLDISNGFKPYQAGYGVNLNGKSLTVNDVNNRIYHSSINDKITFKKEIKGKGINRYSLRWEESYINWGKWLMSPKSSHYFEQSKILLRQVISDYLFAYLDEEKYYADQSLYVCTNYQNKEKENLDFYVALLNSKLYGFYFRKFYSEEDDLFPKIKVNELKNLPIKELSKEKQKPYIEKSILITKLIKLQQELSHKFQRSLDRKFKLENLPKKLEMWYLLSYSDFINELAKKKVKLSLADEAEREECFTSESKKALELKNKIDATDKEIDQMVYTLYDLTKEEIDIVEKS